tara:strand:- start:3512 stop:4207 length:696 start_codon:yes stop_codon:yes gene_type:complete
MIYLIQKYALLTIFFATSFLFAQPSSSVAVLTKVKGNVQIQKSLEKNSEFSLGKAGQLLNHKDIIKTSANAFAVLIYLDDKSMVKLRANTNLEIQGERIGKTLKKNLELTAGTVRATVSKQRRGEFSISSPTSVASVKGTDLWFQSDAEGGDVIYCLEGIVQLINNSSGEIVDLLMNQTGLSTPDGNLSVTTTNSADIPVDEDDSGQEPKEFRIKFKDSDGAEKVLIIKYN